MKLSIDLYDMTGDRDEGALVICAPTGIHYNAQCGGMSCDHPSAEGFYMPIWILVPDIDDHEYGCSNLNKSPPPHDRPDLRKKLADAIDQGLTADAQRRPLTVAFRFDYERIDELKEGWWPLRITGTLNGVGPLDHRCYCHAGNCD